MSTHELKTWPDPFDAVWAGKKKADFRKDDREPRFEIGDYLHLREWSPETDHYSGRMIACIVSDIRRGSTFGIPEGYAMMSLDGLMRYPRGTMEETR